MTKVMTQFVSGPSSSAAAFIGTLGLAVMLVEIVAIVLVARNGITLIA